MTERGSPTEQLAAEERIDLADYLAGLTPEQWDRPTLCEAWRVRDVVAHVVSYEGLSPTQLASRFARGRFLPDRINSVGLTDHAGASPAELLEKLRRHAAPQGLTAGFGGRVGLVDTLIHHQDIRRPLGDVRTIPRERLLAALPFARFAPPIRALWHTRGVRLVASDVDWCAGRGPEARGPGEAILLAMAGRRGVAEELTGPGASTLVDRLG